ncbi:MAG TPA: rRNA pseudouridine synthase [Desulfocapsa sulfexigens]|nr:rRNA pseudouridine synthase [Desulfocapsa sulfexigens]
MEEPVRLQKFLARAGIASRRKAEEYIAQGRVKVDGRIVTAMGQQITPGKQKVFFDNKEVIAEEQIIYILLNKPKGYVTTLSDPQGRPIVTSLLQGIKERVFPVGRLDLDTEGALLLTNDGKLAQSILHPSNEVFKTYEAEVKGCPSANAIRSLEKGILLENKKTAPANLRIKHKKNKNSVIIITIHEGRKRQVKKMFEAVGHPVQSLKRLAYGRLGLNGLPVGKFKILHQSDIKKIFSNKTLYKQKNS